MSMDQNNNFNGNVNGNYPQQFPNMNNTNNDQPQYMAMYMGENENCVMPGNGMPMLSPQALTPIMVPLHVPMNYGIASNIMPPINVSNQKSTGLIQLNGRKVLGPPENWEGPPPSGKCELYLRRVPKELNESNITAPFSRFGPLYDLRLPLDYNQQNRGYAYIKYTNEEDSKAALEVMQHYFIAPGVKFEIQRSYEKSRLYITNVPAALSEQEIEQKLRQVFPNLQNVYFQDTMGFSYYNDATTSSEIDESAIVNHSAMARNNSGCRGNLIIEFASHAHALEAKKSTNPGIIRIWGVDSKVLWANTEREADLSNSNKTLFIRNIDLTINPRDITEFLAQYVNRSQILKVTRVRTSAFVDFATRESAEYILQKLQGFQMKNRHLELEWSKPCDQQSVHRLRSMDFDAVLRLKCIANNWLIPIVLFGTYFEENNLQYGVVILRNNERIARAIFCILQPSELVDIHSRMCEVVCVLIETIGTFPDCNYVFFTQKDMAHLIGLVQHTVQGLLFCASSNIPPEFMIDLTEISDLSCAVAVLTSTPEEYLLAAYSESFRCHTLSTYLQGYPLSHRIIGTIMPKYRNKPPLRYNLNDSQIVLALCFASTGSNHMLPSRPHLNMSASLFDSGCEKFRFMSMQLLPISLTQTRVGVKYVLSHVQFGNTNQYYHPEQRVMSPPLWISVCSYSTSIRQPSSPSTDSAGAAAPEIEEISYDNNHNMHVDMTQMRSQMFSNDGLLPTPILTNGGLLPTPKMQNGGLMGYPGVRSA